MKPPCNIYALCSLSHIAILDIARKYQELHSLDYERVANTLIKDKELCHILIGAVLFIVLALLLPTNEGLLTMTGALSLAAIIMSLYYFLTIGITWPSMLLIVLFCLFGSLGSVGIVFGNSFGSVAVVFFIIAIVLNSALVNSGVTKRIALWFLTRKIIQNNPWRFIVMFMLSAYVIGLVLDSAALGMMYLVLINEVLEAIGVERGSVFCRALSIGTLITILVVVGSTPIGHLMPILLLTLAEDTLGVQISWVRYMAVGIPLTFSLFIATIFILRVIFKFDKAFCEKFKNLDVRKMNIELPPFNRDAILTIAVYSLVIVGWLFPDITRAFFPEIAIFVAAQGIAIPGAIGMIFLCIFRKKGTNEPIINFTKELQKVPWSLIVFAGALFVTTVVINHEEIGIRSYLISLISPILHVINPLSIVFLGILIVIVGTNFISTAVAQTVVFSVFAPALMNLPDSGICTVAFAVMIAITANIVYMTPPSSPVAAFFYSGGYIKIKDGFRLAPVAIVGCLLAMLFFPLANLLF